MNAFALAINNLTTSTPAPAALPRIPAKGEEKACSACKEVKPVDAFYLQSGEGERPDRYSSACKVCIKGRKDSRRRR